MPDPTPTPAPTPEPKKNAARGEINQSWLDEFTSAEAIVTATKVAERPAILTDGGIDAAKIAALTKAIADARKLAGQAVQGTSDKEVITDEEAGLKKILLEKIQYIQKRARQKYDATEPGRLKDFGIGTARKIDDSRSLLEQFAANLLLKLTGNPTAVPPVPAESLPGVTPAKIGELQAALDDYKNVQGDQTGAQGDATGWRKQCETAVADIATKRREIQFAADAEWPHTDPANAGIRGEFQLPPDRVMK
jgi:hypothetical protein